MTNAISQIEFFLWIRLFSIPVFVILALKVLRAILDKGNSKIENRKNRQRIIALADFLGIIIIVIYFSRHIMTSQVQLRLYVAFIFLILVLWLIRSIVNDLLSGIILRLEHAFEMGDMLETEEGKGIIKKIGLRSLNLTMDQGKQISIPYSRFISKSVAKPSSMQPIKTAVFEIAVPLKSSIIKTESTLKSKLLSLPWTLTSIGPSVEPVEELETGIRFKVTVRALEIEHLSEIEHQLRKSVAGM